MKRTMMIMAMLFMACAVYGKDFKTLVVTTNPQMQCSSCEDKIKGNMRFEKGVKSIETNIEQQAVTIVYDAEKTNEETLIKAFEKFGYKAEKKVVEKKTADKKVEAEKATAKKDCCENKGEKKECAKKECSEKKGDKHNCTKKDCSENKENKKDCEKKDCKESNNGNK